MVDILQAVRQADLSQVRTDVAGFDYGQTWPPSIVSQDRFPPDSVLTTSPALRVCVAGEGEPPLELLQAARQDRKANLFLDRFVAMQSYEEFCEFMGEWSTLTMWQRQNVNKDGARRQISELGS